MKILGISAKKQGGKNTAANYLNGVILKKTGAIKDFTVLDNGELNVLTEFEDGTEDWGILDLYRKDEAYRASAEETVWPYVKNYSFADILKEVSVNLFGLKPESVYGNEEQRAAPTHLLWENMPGVVTQKLPGQHFKKVEGRLGYYYEIQEFEDDTPESYHLPLVYHKPGQMSGREFLQFFGTEIGRKIHGPIWINATMNKILAEQSGLAIITDVRFPDEVMAIKNAGGMVIRLTRQIDGEDRHASEVSLDPDVFDWDNFNYVINNQDLTIKETSDLISRFCYDNNIL